LGFNIEKDRLAQILREGKGEQGKRMGFDMGKLGWGESSAPCDEPKKNWASVDEHLGADGTVLRKLRLLPSSLERVKKGKRSRVHGSFPKQRETVSRGNRGTGGEEAPKVCEDA